MVRQWSESKFLFDFDDSCVQYSRDGRWEMVVGNEDTLVVRHGNVGRQFTTLSRGTLDGESGGLIAEDFRGLFLLLSRDELLRSSGMIENIDSRDARAECTIEYADPSITEPLPCVFAFLPVNELRLDETPMGNSILTRRI